MVLGGAFVGLFIISMAPDSNGFLKHMYRVLCLIVAIMLLSSCNEFVCNNTEIETVGGCSQDGQCGVRYKNGEFGTEYRPTPGEPIKVCKRITQ